MTFKGFWDFPYISNIFSFCRLLLRHIWQFCCVYEKILENIWLFFCASFLKVNFCWWWTLFFEFFCWVCDICYLISQKRFFGFSNEIYLVFKCCFISWFTNLISFIFNLSFGFFLIFFLIGVLCGFCYFHIKWYFPLEETGWLFFPITFWREVGFLPSLRQK